MSLYCSFNYNGYPKGLNYPWDFPRPSESERDLRWQAIRSSMVRHGYECIIPTALATFIPSTRYIQYISNYFPFATKGIYVVFPADGEPQMQVNNANGPQFLQFAYETSWIKDVVGSFDPLDNVVRKINELKLQKGKMGILGYKQGLFPAAALDRLRKNLPEASISDASAVVHEAMHQVSRKSEEELKFLRRACEILDLSYNAVVKAFQPGASELDLWAEAEYAIIKNGGWPSHNFIATTAHRPIFPRIPPSHRKLLSGDVGIFEVTALYAGVHPQTCYAISLGKPETKVMDMFDFCEELYQYSLTELEKQTPYPEIEQGLSHLIHSRGFEPTTPQIHIFNYAGEMPSDGLPQPGDYFTVHPNLSDSRYTVSAKLGDCVRITDRGKVERLNKPPARLNII